MTEEPKRAGRAQVRELFLQRCEEAGLARPKGRTVEGQAAFETELADRLSYMVPENLETLADLVVDAAPCKRGVAVWPSEAVIRHLARCLQRPPVDEGRLVTSWLASIEGPPAVAGGWAAHLLRHLMRTGRPPSDYEVAEMRREAEDDHRRAARIRDRMRRGLASDQDRAWLEQLTRDTARAEAIVGEGRERRDGRDASIDQAVDGGRSA